ncbi:hypothetical protein KFK09_008851 [Dendrobium nobile]|uniref:Mitochondrial protein n=1 Tax=Dendrobium nobile TaxID=94219 RepID=A0A8T3BNW8_DENNO|nr:hypothetical protein KFK09_008851 [Dendrobium nobile]
MKNLGLAHRFLGIKIQKLQDKYFLSQSAYANSILNSVNLLHCNPLSNPSCTKLPDQVPNDSNLSANETYKRVTGSLQYLTLTRPDIAHAVNVLSQHLHEPSQTHAYLLKRLLRYIKGTLSFGLPILPGTLNLSTYSDAGWAGDPVTRKSTTGHCTYLGSTLVSWTVKKQTTVARSSTESEYRALAAATADTIWLKRLLNDFSKQHSQPIELFCDNTSAIALAHNPVYHACTKHIEIDHQFVRDHIQNQVIRLTPIGTLHQIADIFTKPLPTARFKDLRSKLTIQDESLV